MQKQLVTAVVAGLVVWWVTEQVKRWRDERATDASPVAGVSEAEAASEAIMV